MLNIKGILLKIEENIKEVIKGNTPLGISLWQGLLKYHPADIAVLLERLQKKYLVGLFKKLPSKIQIKVFEEFSEQNKTYLLGKLDPELATIILRDIPTDSLIELFDFLSDEDLKKYIKMLQKKQRNQIISRLNFEEDSAGRIMNSDVLTLQKDFTVKKCISILQRIGEKKELLKRIYVNDKDNVLIGYVNLVDLVVNKPDVLIKNILHKNELVLNFHLDQEEAAKEIHHYGLFSAPVVDNENHFLGVITSDDVLDIIEEEASEDVYKMSGQSPVEYSYFDTPLWRLIWQRGPWLIGLLLLQSVSSFILEEYKDVVDKYFIISMFLTMLIGTGGNAGNQSSAIVIRGLATGQISKKNDLRVLLREFFASTIMAGILVIVGFTRVYLFRHDLISALAVSVSLFIIVIVSMFLGTLLPILLERLNLDPAHSAAPFLATIMDILGVLIYCFVVSKILG